MDKTLTMNLLCNYIGWTVRVDLEEQIIKQRESAEPCSCCGVTKHQILDGIQISAVVTQDGIYNPDIDYEMPYQDVLFETWIEFHDTWIGMDIPFWPVGLDRKQFLESFIVYLNNQITLIEQEHNVSINRTFELADVTIGTESNPQTINHGRFGVTHPLFDSTACSVCPEHGVEFLDIESIVTEPQVNDWIVTRLREVGYVSRQERDETSDTVLVSKYINPQGDSEAVLSDDEARAVLGMEYPESMMSEVSSEHYDCCCGDATTTWNIYDSVSKERAEQFHGELLTALRNEVQPLLADIRNPYDEYNMPSTDVLLPYVYKHGEDGVTYWNAIADMLITESYSGETPILNPTDELHELVDYTGETGPTPLKYIELTSDLFTLLRYEYPLIPNEELYTNLLRILDVASDADVDGFVWGSIVNQTDIDIVIDEMNRSQSSNQSQYYTTELYHGVYDSNIFAYDAESVYETCKNKWVIVHGSETVAWPDNVDVLCEVREPSMLHELNDNYTLNDEHTQFNPPIEPHVAWLDPAAIVLSENMTLSLSELQKACNSTTISTDASERGNWIPLRNEHIENTIESARQGELQDMWFEEEIPITDCITLPSNDDTINDKVKHTQSHVKTLELNRFIDSAAMDSRDGLYDVVWEYPTEDSFSNSVGGHDGWGTGIEYTEFPVRHVSDATDKELEPPYVTAVHNYVSTRENDRSDTPPQYVYPDWDSILPDGTEPRDLAGFSADTIRDVIVNKTPYEPTDKLHVCLVSKAVIMRDQLETNQLIVENHPTSD